MKSEIFKPVSDALSSRFKTPLVSSFVFAWLIFNHAIVLEFLLTTVDAKIEMLNTLYFDWETDVILPLASALFFMISVPALQLSLDIFIFVTLGNLRKTLDKNVARNTVEATVDYQEKLMNLDMEGWQTEKQKLQKRVEYLEKFAREKTDTLAKKEKEIARLVSSNKKMNQDISKAVQIFEDAKHGESINHQHTVNILKKYIASNDDTSPSSESFVNV